jgi:hypothetical protein
MALATRMNMIENKMLEQSPARHPIRSGISLQ